jgi:hypothetical protein
VGPRRPRTARPPEHEEEVVGDLEEVHRARLERHRPAVAAALTALDTLDVAGALLRERWRARGRRQQRPGGWDAARVSRLDFVLGFRMLVKYPGLTLVGGFAFAFAIWVAAGAFEFAGQVLHPRLPLPDGERVVALESWDAAAGRPERRVLHDFATWRTELRSVEELGAYRLAQRNLATADGESLPVEAAEISASAFRVARARPLLGRALAESDERPDAPLVAVIGYDVWQDRFGGDPNVVGRVVQLGRTPATVVGVMPAGYAFPVAQSLWVPLRVPPLEYPRGAGPGLELFGRLAPGVTLAEAQAELTTLGRRAAADFPSTHRYLRPRVVPYATSVAPITTSELFLARTSYGFFIMLVVLICGNVALLLFARAATREGELAIRNALGASRGRIVAQLFAEALVLGGVAAAAALGAAGVGVRLLVGAFEMNSGQRLPFWYHADLSPRTVLYATGLTVLGAAIAGVLPGLKVTRGLQARLRQAAAGAGGLTFGGVWTAVIVAQIAVTLAFPWSLSTWRATRRTPARWWPTSRRRSSSPRASRSTGSPRRARTRRSPRSSCAGRRPCARWSGGCARSRGSSA